ncbi:phospholipid scramblase 1 [Arachnomyces sp. PD_36]|nr:phospholipid scramblase 1 [Arachnomyces sp. PD_36]
MVNKILASFVAADVVFVLCGGLLLGVALVSRAKINEGQSLDNVKEMILLEHCPLTAAIANAGLIMFTFILSLPAMMFPDNRLWLKVHGWFVVICALFTLVLGLEIWFHTLKTRAYLGVIWDEQPARTQSLLQQSFNCCGYLNSTSPPFQVDETCPTPLAAAQKLGCVGPFSDHANGYLDLIFTADFGIVAVDVILLLCVAIILKDRKERHRYRLIDAKNGVNRI